MAKNQTKKQPAKQTHNQTSRQPNKPIKKVRGTLLSVIIILIGLLGLLGVYLARLTLKQEYLTQTTWVLPLLILAGLLTVVAAIGLWQWKKWGIYLYVITQIMAMIAHLVLTGSLYVVFYDLIPLLILGTVLNEGDRLRFFD
jgi:cell division protein FtsW (lipid II flippase)